MKIGFAAPRELDGWMELVDKVKDSFPGLETKEALDAHRKTVQEFVWKR